MTRARWRSRPTPPSPAATRCCAPRRWPASSPSACSTACRSSRCERVYVKYRVGESLRVVYRYDGRYVAARTGKRDGIAAPEVGAALYPFPHDRKLTALAALATGRAAPARPPGHDPPRRLRRRAVRDRRVPRRARPHRSPTPRSAATTASAAAHSPPRRVRVPRVLASADGVLLLEALEGTPPRHASTPSHAPRRHPRESSPHEHKRGQSPFIAALSVERLATAAEVIGRARPDVAPGRRAVAAAAARAQRGFASARACALHGDANLRNAILLPSGEVALLDLEDVCARARGGGSRAGARRADRGPDAARGGASCCAATATPPDRAALRWYTAASLLARVALPAVSRYRPDVLARLRELLDAGAALVARGRGRRMKPALLFYCQHSVGLGHLMRSYALCEKLADRFRVVLLCGGELPARHRRRRPTSSSSRCRRSASSPARASAAATRATRPSDAWAIRAQRIHETLQRDAPEGRARRAVPVRAREVRPRAGPAARGRRATRARSPPAACATSSSARARTSASTTTARRGSRTPTSTRCSSTATRASPASRRRSSRANR